MLWSKSSTFFEKIYFLLLSAFVAFPVIDYVLRNLLPIPIISSIWDDMLLVTGLFMVVLRILIGNPRRKTELSKIIFSVILIGVAYLVLDLTTFGINLEGFRAMFQFMFVFFLAFYLNDRPENTKALLSLAVVIGTLIAVYGIYQYIMKVPMPGRWVDSGESGVTRAFSIIGSPNALGSQMAMLIPISLGLLMYEKPLNKKLFWLACTGLMAACLLFTGSRGAWLALAGAIAVIGMLYDRRILIAGIVLAIVAAVGIPAVKSRITYLFTAEYMMKSSQSGRISRWFDAYDQMRNSPLFGSGLGHWGGAVAKRAYNVTYTDNYYMKTLAEMGLLGVSAFLWLIWSSLKEGYNTMKRLNSPHLKYLAAGMLGGLLVIVLHNAVENIFEIPYLNSYFWFIAGLLAALPFNAASTGGDIND
jgi:putative inorganic carbon (HCO3(-)) transporter